MTVPALAPAETSTGRRRLPLPSTSWVFLVSGVLLVAHILVAAFGPLLSPYDPLALLTGRPFEGPSAHHWLGTDSFGRDVLSRLVAGERIILAQALATSALAASIGALLGIVAAYVRGWFDAAVMRVVELVLSFPSLIVGMLLLTAVGRSPVAVVFIVAALFVAPVTTVVRAAALGVVTEDFVTAARLRGENNLAIARREILPNVLPTVFVEFSLRTGYAAILIGSLGFLGFGAAPPTPDWGLMINEGRDFLQAAPWTVLAPALGLGSLVVALSLFTEGLTDLLSPRGLAREERA
jgi:peptide/nickel transport system permease protein